MAESIKWKELNIEDFAGYPCKTCTRKSKTVTCKCSKYREWFSPLWQQIYAQGQELKAKKLNQAYERLKNGG